ncbi:hypothetical protein FB446DRAFT_841705 [Lentinula raphanica]|nr:hypothetical protein FB446DRAFT_841705 [Lentinula raphanica]
MPRKSERDVGTRIRLSKRKDNLPIPYESPRRYPKKIQELVEANSGDGQFGGWKISSELARLEPTGSSEGREGELRFESTSPPSILLHRVEPRSTAMEYDTSIPTTRETTPSSDSLGWSLTDAQFSPANIQAREGTSHNYTRPHYDSSYSDDSGKHAGFDVNLFSSQFPGRPQSRHSSFPGFRASRISARNSSRSVPGPTHAQSTEIRNHSGTPPRESLLWTVDSPMELAPSIDGMTPSSPSEYSNNALSPDTSADHYGRLSPLQDFRLLQPDSQLFDTSTGHQSHFGVVGSGNRFAHQNTEYDPTRDYYDSTNRGTEVNELEYWINVDYGNSSSSNTPTNNPSSIPPPNELWQQTQWVQHIPSLHLGRSTPTSTPFRPYARSPDRENGNSRITMSQQGHGASFISADWQGSEYLYSDQLSSHAVQNSPHSHTTHFSDPNHDSVMAPHSYDVRPASASQRYPYTYSSNQ